MKRLLLPLLLAAFQLHAADPGRRTDEPPPTPRVELYAEFTANSKCPVFTKDDAVRLWVKVVGDTTLEDSLLWGVSDWQGKLVDKGAAPVPMFRKAWTTTIELGKYGSGYFEVHLKLDKLNITLPAAGSRPAGMVSYAVLPDLKPLALEFADQSRFGAMGDCFITSAGNRVDPVYGLIGAKWKYLARWPFALAKAETGPDAYSPCLDPAKAKAMKSHEADAGLCVIVDAHTLPTWLIKFPDNLKLDDKAKTDRSGNQAYPPNDYGKYADLIGKIAAEQAVLKKTHFPHQRKNYYQIHWEPDWAWKGTDEDFVKMYACAQQAIKANDPDGMLLGANYGVLATGNKHLERLFGKGLANYLDGIVFHTYYLPQQQSPEKGGLIQDMRKLVALRDANLRPGAPLINTEWGVHLWRNLPLPNLAVLDQEAAYFMRGHLITLGEGANATCFFYAADFGENGWGWGLFYHLTLPNSMFGPTNIAPKPVFSAAAAATRLLEGAKNLGALEHLGANVWGYAFARGDKVVATLWATDDRTRDISVAVGADTVAYYDAMGNEKIVQCADGQARVSIGAAPVYLLGIDKAMLPAGAAPGSYFPGDQLDSGTLMDGKNARLSLFSGSARHELQGTVPRGAAPGKCLVAARDKDSGKWLAGRTLDIKAPVAISRQDDTAYNRMAFQLVNLLDEKVSGSFSLEAEGQAEAIQSQKVEMPPHGSATVTIDVGQRPRQSIAGASFTDTQGVRSQVDLHERDVFLAGKSTRPPSIDGDLKEWQLELFKTISGKDAVDVNPQEWRGDPDLSFKAATLYDADALYLALKVRDQDHCQTELPGELWKADSVQLGVGLHPDKGAWKAACSLAFAKSSGGNGELTAYSFSRMGEIPNGQLDLKKIRCAVKRAGDETFYEIAIPWNVLDKALASFPAERRIGIGVLVNDMDVESDGRKGKRKAMKAFGGMGKETLGIVLLQ